MKTNILVINGHPDTESYCSALAQAYSEGVAGSHPNVRVRRLNLNELEFEPNLKYGYRKRTELEDCLVQAQAWIREADHLVFVYPTWWGAMPAILKGFIDRVFLPGFAFKYRENSPFWDKLLTGKTARLIVTMDTPSFYNRFVYKRAGHGVMKRNILQFCGVNPVRITELGPVRPSTEEKRKKWLDKVKKLGSELA